jgi:hypothetical protein
MPKAIRRKSRIRTAKKRRKIRTPESIPLSIPTSATLQLASSIDALVGKGKLTPRNIATHRSRVMGGMARTMKGSFAGSVASIGVYAFMWPDGMYVPRNTTGAGYLKPPSDRLYTHAWTDNRGISWADQNAGTMFSWSGVPTTQRDQVGEAGLGILYSPKNALSYIRFEPEVNCNVTYRGFVDYWPMLIAGTVRCRGSIIMAAWQVTTILNNTSFELLHPWREVVVFDTGKRDAASDLSPDIHSINTFPKNLSWSDLRTTFLLQGGRTYLLGVVARVEVHHTVTTSDGKVIPHDGLKFKLYSSMACNVPDMFVSIQNVLLP